ncbi:MAG: sulfate adenylyltransferase subunit CysD [Crocinitomix sp.]|nr:sulfate adenylyltransferase subunit CysD [Crocinitomix sp.]
MFLPELENEAIHIMREVAAQFKHPLILFSGGKDSLTLIHLAYKAFWPAPIPFKVLHIDTGHNFPETIAFRDKIADQYQLDLVVGSVQASIDKGDATEEQGRDASRNALQTVTLLSSIADLQADACIGGARRDEEKARAKERIFSVRNNNGGWDAEAQRPELWNLYNGHIQPNQNVRIFPLSNWTELDVWNYILTEKLEVPSIYFTHQRQVFYRDNVLMPHSEHIIMDGETVFGDHVRFRTVGDMSCTAAIKSDAMTVAEIIDEITHSEESERGARMDDQRSACAMEDRKSKGYF